jgi:hypothetical protein
MATSKSVSKTGSGFRSEVSRVRLEARNNFLLQVALGAIKAQSDTHWDELKCIGYNPEIRRLEELTLSSLLEE